MKQFQRSVTKNLCMRRGNGDNGGSFLKVGKGQGSWGSRGGEGIFYDKRQIICDYARCTCLTRIKILGQTSELDAFIHTYYVHS